MSAPISFSLPKKAVPTERCYWVVDDLLLAGAYPGHANPKAHQDRIAKLWDAGMRTFINLMEEDELNKDDKPFVRYDDILRQRADKLDGRIAHLRFPIKDGWVTTADRMRSILDAIDLSLSQKIPTYIHCFGGMGRTGTVICCWLLRHGYTTKDNVLPLLKDLREADLLRADWPAPENEEQRQFVLTWPESPAKPSSPTKPMAQQPRTVKTGRNWFERQFGFAETDRGTVHKKLAVEGTTLRSKVTDERWTYGSLEIVALSELRSRVQSKTPVKKDAIKVSELIGDAKSLHLDPENAGAVFQVASQFNLLEMVSPSITPDAGITIYENDPTQGPACAIACGAGTVYRNYFVNLDGQIGQTADKQVDCLDAIGERLGNQRGKLWSMKNGYALPTAAGLQEVNKQLAKMSESELDELRGLLKIGVQWNTQVTLNACEHLVTQAYCSAVPVAYSGLPSRSWERLARLVLDAAYEATFAAAVLNAAAANNTSLYLTLLGGGAFGNEQSWILDAISRSIKLYRDYPIDIKVVSFRSSNPAVRALCKNCV